MATTMTEPLEAIVVQNEGTIILQTITIMVRIRDSHRALRKIDRGKVAAAASDYIAALERCEKACEKFPHQNPVPGQRREAPSLRQYRELIAVRDTVISTFNVLVEVGASFNFETVRGQPEAQEIYHAWLVHWWQPMARLRELLQQFLAADPDCLSCFQGLGSLALGKLRSYPDNPLSDCNIPADPAAPVLEEAERDGAMLPEPQSRSNKSNLPEVGTAVTALPAHAPEEFRITGPWNGLLFIVTLGAVVIGAFFTAFTRPTKPAIEEPRRRIENDTDAQY